MKTIGVIGLGSIGMRHAKNLKRMGHNVVGFDPVLVGDGFPSMWPVRRLDELDAIVVASPTEQHGNDLVTIGPEMLSKSFFEKPICTRLNNPFAREVAMVGYNLRFHGCVKVAKEWIDSGKIGDPQWANFTLGQHSEKPAYLRTGVILNWSHEIDLALYLLGPAMVAGSNTLVRDGKDEMTDILLTHQTNAPRFDPWITTIHLDYISNPEVRRFRIQGTRGIIEVDLVRFSADLYCDEPTEPFRWKDHTWNDTYIEEMEEFLAIVDNPNAPVNRPRIGATGADGLAVLKICLEVRKQAELV